MNRVLVLLFICGHTGMRVSGHVDYYRRADPAPALVPVPDPVRPTTTTTTTAELLNDPVIDDKKSRVDITTTVTPDNSSVKWGIGVPGFDCLYDIPRMVNDALGQNWTFVPRPENAVFPAMGMFCPPKDFTFCVLYDPIHGYVAGIQVAIPVAILKAVTDSYLEDVGFIKWINAEGEFWTTSQYYVSSDGPQQAPKSEEILRENSIWIPDFQGTLMKIGNREKDAEAAGFVKQGCRMAVGRHYFYKMTDSMKCTEILPWYLLYDKGILVGTGFIVTGKMPKPEYNRDWFEVADLQLMKQSVPKGPQCLLDSVKEPGIITSKIYFVDQPYQLGWSSYCFN